MIVTAESVTAATVPLMVSVFCSFFFVSFAGVVGSCFAIMILADESSPRPSVVTSKAAMCGHLKTGHREAAGTSGFYAFVDSLSIPFLSLSCNLSLGPPTARAKLQDMAVMQQAIEHGRHRCGIA